MLKNLHYNTGQSRFMIKLDEAFENTWTLDMKVMSQDFINAEVQNRLITKQDSNVLVT